MAIQEKSDRMAEKKGISQRLAEEDLFCEIATCETIFHSINKKVGELREKSQSAF